MNKQKEYFPYTEVTHLMRLQYIRRDFFKGPHANTLRKLSLSADSHQAFLDEMKQYAQRMAVRAYVGHWFVVILTAGMILLWKKHSEYLNLDTITHRNTERFHDKFTLFPKPAPPVSRTPPEWLRERDIKHQREHEEQMAALEVEHKAILERVEQDRTAQAEENRRDAESLRKIRELIDNLRRALPAEEEPLLVLNQ